MPSSVFDRSYSYDTVGNVLSITDNRTSANNETFGYDQRDRLTNATYAGSAHTYSYNAIGNLTSKAGVAYTYPAPGSARPHTPTSVGSTAYSYDLNGNLANDGGWQYIWNAENLPLSVSQTSGTESYTYDAAWRPLSVCSDRSGQACYVSGATYTALDQPASWTFGNTLGESWSYSSPLQRLQQLRVGPSGSLFNRSYSYDNGGNILTIIDNKLNPTQTQTFSYDHRDRLLHAWTSGNTANSYDETYSYAAIGNLLSKTSMGTYSYPASGQTSVRPHTPSAVNGATYVYDGNGNLTGSGGRTLSWNVDNRITSVSQVSGNESYSYDADGERATRTRGSTTTLYFEGLWEESAGGAAQIAYTFNNEVVAVRDSGTNAVTYLHTDQIGSVSLATSASGVGTVQEYYPWGTHRGGDTLTQTTLDYTGQRADATGLLYYHARYYDPALGRFFSPDTQAPDTGTPQDLNPYSYIHNNPVRYNDPSGHCIPFLSSDCAPVWQTGQGLNTHDFAQYSAGVVEGMGSLGAAAASLAKPETWDAAGQALSAAIADPPAAAAAAVDQGKAMVENAASVISDPGGTVAALNDNPRALGRALGGAAANLALAAAGGSAATEAEESEAFAACANSFRADTPVATADGAIAIGEIRVGDHVLAWNPATGTTGSYTVTATISHQDQVVVDLTLDTERLETTAHHPFFTLEHGWVDAGRLWLGAHVRGADGSAGVVQGVLFEAQPQPMYNLTVAIAHTFFVGQQRWLVHNAGCGPVQAGEAGRFADLDARRVTGDQLTPHHMPQAALGFTSREEGGALMLTDTEHAATRTFAGRGVVTARQEAGMPFRQVLARDIGDVRRITGSKYNQGIRDLIDYYETNFPSLIAK